MKKYFLMSVLGIAVFFSSCKKDNNTPEPVKTVTSINELNPSKSFDWKTTKDVTLNVTGQPVPVEIKHKIKVKGEDGTLYFSYYHKMSDNLSMKIELPTYVKKVIVEFGTIKKEIAITGNTINFKFSPDIANED